MSKVARLTAALAAAAEDDEDDALVPLLREANSALADLVAAVETVAENTVPEVEEKDEITRADVQALIKAISQVAERTVEVRAQMPTPQITVQPCDVVISAPSGWSFNFKVETNAEGLITGLSGNAKRN